VQFLEQSTPIFIPPDLWLPNSTDLNPVDYKMWGDVQQQVHQSQLHSIEKELKNRLLNVWHGMDHSVIDDAIDGDAEEASLSVYTGKRCTLRATVVNFTRALSAKPYDKRFSFHQLRRL